MSFGDLALRDTEKASLLASGLIKFPDAPSPRLQLLTKRIEKEPKYQHALTLIERDLEVLMQRIRDKKVLWQTDPVLSERMLALKETQEIVRARLRPITH